MIAILEYLSAHLIAFSLEMTVLIAVIAVADRLMRNIPSAIKYLLWMAVLVRIAVPVSVPVPDVVADWVRGLTVVSVPVERIQVQTPVIIREEPVLITELPASVQSVPPPVEQTNLIPPVSVHAVIGLVWAVVAGMLIAVCMVRCIVMRDILNKTVDLRNNIINSLVTRLSYLMGIVRPVKARVWNVRSKEAVALAGVLHPRILLPRAMADTWSSEDLEPVIMHELAHVKRADLVVNWLQVIIQVVYFFHPLVWYMNHRIRNLREEACDDLALSALGGSRKRYVESMLRVLDETTYVPSFGFAAIGFSERRSNIGERIRRIMDMRGTSRSRLTARAVCGLAAVLITAFIVSCGAGSVWRVERGDEVSVTDIEDRQNIQLEEQQQMVRSILTALNRDTNVTLAALRTSENSSILLDALYNLASAVSKEIGLDVSVRDLAPDDPALLDCSIAFVLGTDDMREMSPEETANVEDYIRNGGVLYGDIIDWNLEYGFQERNVRMLLSSVLESDYRPLPIPSNNRLYSIYYKIDGAPKINPESSDYIEGCWLNNGIKCLFSDNGYINHWAANDADEHMKFGVNIVVHSLLTTKRIYFIDDMDSYIRSKDVDEQTILIRSDSPEPLRDNSSLMTFIQYHNTFDVVTDKGYRLVRGLFENYSGPSGPGTGVRENETTIFSTKKLAEGDSIVIQLFDRRYRLQDWDGSRTITAADSFRFVAEYRLYVESVDSPDESGVYYQYRLADKLGVPMESATTSEIRGMESEHVTVENHDDDTYFVNGDVIGTDASAIEIEVIDDTTYRIDGDRVSRNSLQEVFKQRNELVDVSALITVIRYYPAADIKAAEYAVALAESFGVTNIQMSVEMDMTKDVMMRPYNESFCDISWWQLKSDLISYVLRGLKDSGKKVYVIYDTNRFIPPYEKSLEVSYEKSFQNLVSQLKEIDVDYQVLEMKYWNDSAQNSGAGITSAGLSEIIHDAQDAKYYFELGQERQLEQLTIEILDDTTYRVFGKTVSKDDLEQTLQANMDPDVSYIVLLSNRSDLLNEALFAVYNEIVSNLSPLEIAGIDFIEEDESIERVSAPGSSELVPDPMKLENLDDGSYLINGEVVARDDLERFSDAVIIKDAGENAPSRPVADNSSLNVAISGQAINGQSTDRFDESNIIPTAVQSASVTPTDDIPDVVTPAQYLLPTDSSIPFVEDEGKTCSGVGVSFSVVNDSTYLVDDVEVHRDDLEDVVRGKSVDMVDMLTRLSDPFGPYAFLWNTLNSVSTEQAGERKPSELNDLVVDVIDENTVRLAESEVSLTDIEGAIADIIGSDNRYRLVICADANITMRTINNVEDAAFHNGLPGITRYEVR